MSDTDSEPYHHILDVPNLYLNDMESQQLNLQYVTGIQMSLPSLSTLYKSSHQLLRTPKEILRQPVRVTVAGPWVEGGDSRGWAQISLQ